MRRAFLLLLTLALPATALTSCSWFGDSDLHQALSLVPADATSVEFVDRAQIADRLGVDDVHTGASPDDITRYLQAVADQPVSGTDFFLPSLQVMQDAPFSELDVKWSVVGHLTGGGFQAFKLDDDVDLGALGDELADAGFDESDDDGRRHFTALPENVTDPANGLVAGHFPSGFLDVTLDPDHHLVLLGSQVDAVLHALDDDTASLADDDADDDLLPDSDTTELALLDTAPDCGSKIGNLSKEQVAEAVKASADLATPSATSYVVDGKDGDADPSSATERATLRFPDAATASSDAAARQAYLGSGRLVTSGSDLDSLGTVNITTSGGLEHVDVHYQEPGRATELAERGDGFLLCHVAPATPAS